MKNLYRNTQTALPYFFFFIGVTITATIYSSEKQAALKEPIFGYPIKTVPVADQEKAKLNNANYVQRASAEQKTRDKTYIHTIKAALGILPPHLKDSIAEYAQPGWLLDTTLNIHSERIYSIQCDDTGRSVTSLTDEKNKELASWDPRTGTVDHFSHYDGNQHCKRLPNQLSGFSQQAIDPIDFSCSADGKKVAAIDSNKVLYIWPAALSFVKAIGQNTIVSLHDTNKFGGFLSVTFSPCSNYVFVGGINGIIHQIDATTGERPYAFAPNPDTGRSYSEPVTAITTSADGATIYAGLMNGKIAIWRGDIQQNSQRIAAAMPCNSLDGPQNVCMTDEREPLIISGNHRHQQEARDVVCVQNFYDCYEHGKKCCSLSGQCCAVAAPCCRTAALCAVQAPRCCVNHCCCRVCIKRLCIPACNKVWQTIKRLWQ